MLVWDVQGRRNDKREKGLIFPEGYFLIEIYSAGKIAKRLHGVGMYM
jgi:hypothetical protein